MCDCSENGSVYTICVHKDYINKCSRIESCGGFQQLHENKFKYFLIIHNKCMYSDSITESQIYSITFLSCYINITYPYNRLTIYVLSKLSLYQL